jgi:pimeloyl-ACP methyl ester carboxylesterase
MPFTDNRGTRIYWDEQGSGEPLLLIMGLGYPSAMWHRTRPALSDFYRTIALDNRGAGQSDVPPGPYSMALMASDAAAVLDAADVTRAHVFGLSMGGMIAQEFALQYPGRVQSLILGCTGPGGPNAVRAEPAAIEMLKASSQMKREEATEAAVPFIYDTATSRRLIDEDIATRRAWPTSPVGYLAQLQAILAWESFSRLPQITAPTLVIHGKGDRLVPPANAELIAARIPGAQLVLLEHASHLFSTDQPAAAQKAIFEFLTAQPTGANRL